MIVTQPPCQSHHTITTYYASYASMYMHALLSRLMTAQSSDLELVSSGRSFGAVSRQLVGGNQPCWQPADSAATRHFINHLAMAQKLACWRTLPFVSIFACIWQSGKSEFLIVRGCRPCSDALSLAASTYRRACKYANVCIEIYQDEHREGRRCLDPCL